MTIHDIISKHNEDSDSILSIHGDKITYGSLLEYIDLNHRILLSNNIGKEDRVAIVLPNGPKMAIALLSIASFCAAAPLNPGYSEKEYNFFFNDLDAKLLITNEEGFEAAKNVALEKKIKIICLKEDSYLFGDKLLKNNLNVKHTINSNNHAIILHTSGTTSRPKMVALTHKNIVTNATNISSTLNLNKDDISINIMPLFHIHGIMCSLIAPLSVGSKIITTPQFNALLFYRWLEKFKPTWYSGVPTMHQTILERAKNNLDIIKKSKLRFIRSSSSSLAPNIMNELEKTFNTCVIESYGMTEASHQMTSNLLPPNIRKKGTVGFPSGIEVKIVDNKSNSLKTNKIGEILIKGDSVIKEYIDNDSANKESFLNNWFKTGDLGFIDEGGYLTISGRIKEVINRGGEKISPREIDEVFMLHPSVDQAVAFSIKHPKLGEDICIAIVLKPSSECTVGDLKEFVSSKLAKFKIPKKIMIVDFIPKGPTGKLQRIGLSKKLGVE